MKLKSTILPLVLALGSVNSNASEQKMHDYDFLVGARISQLNSQFGDNSDEDTSYGVELIYAKGFEYRPKLSAGVYLAIDVGTANHKGYKDDFDVETWALSPFISYQIVERIELLAKIGVSNWSYKTNASELNGYDPIYGVGGRYNFSNRAYTGFEWQYAEMTDKSVNLDSQLTTFSLGYRF